MGSSTPRAAELSIDRICQAIEIGEPAEDIAEAELDEHFASAYGIFSGKADKTAILRFSASAPAGSRTNAGIPCRWLVRALPRYRDRRESVMDSLRHGA